MKKLSLLLFALFVFTVSFTSSAHAYYFTPSSGNVQKNGTTSISIYAQPPGTGNIVASLRVAFTNATITGFAAANGLSPLGSCSNGNSFVDNYLCVDVGHPIGLGIGYYATGDLIGVVTVQWANINGIATAVKSDTDAAHYAGLSAYYNGSTYTASLGTAGTYNIGTIPSTPLFVDVVPEITLAAAGLAVIFIGIYLYQRTTDEKHSSK